MDLRRIRALKGSTCTVGGEDRTPLGETALLCGTLSLPIADTPARLHAAAQLSQDLVAAIGLLANELAFSDVIRAYAAALTIAFVAAKSDPSLRMDRTEQALIRLEQAAKRARLPCGLCLPVRPPGLEGRQWSGGTPACRVGTRLGSPLFQRPGPERYSARGAARRTYRRPIRHLCGGPDRTYGNSDDTLRSQSLAAGFRHSLPE